MIWIISIILGILMVGGAMFPEGNELFWKIVVIIFGIIMTSGLFITGILLLLGYDVVKINGKNKLVKWREYED